LGTRACLAEFVEEPVDIEKWSGEFIENKVDAVEVSKRPLFG